MIYFSPIEQFQVLPLFTWSNVSFTLMLIFISLIFIEKTNILFRYHISWWYRNFQNVESYIFILLTIWFIILFSNLIGMIPYNSTITAQAVIVLSISLPTFFAINVLGFNLHKWNLFYLILPAGAPLPLIPFIAFLELFSYLIRVFSLTLRLFANMLAGHILMKIILYALLTMPILSILLLPIVLLELMVACVQAYVFLTLTLSYYQDVYVPH